MIKKPTIILCWYVFDAIHLRLFHSKAVTRKTVYKKTHPDDMSSGADRVAAMCLNGETGIRPLELFEKSDRRGMSRKRTDHRCRDWEGWT